MGHNGDARDARDGLAANWFRELMSFFICQGLTAATSLLLKNTYTLLPHRRFLLTTALIASLPFTQIRTTMPPKRAASTKRKATADDEHDSEGSPPAEDFNETVEEAKAAASKRPAPKRAASSKRKAVDEDEDEAEPSAPKASKSKKAKTDKNTKASVAEGADTGLAPNGQPTNKVLPVHIQFPPKTPNTVRIATWNICGLAASSKKVCRYFWLFPSIKAKLDCSKGFKYYVEAEDADVLILTETKVDFQYSRLLVNSWCFCR